MFHTLDSQHDSKAKFEEVKQLLNNLNIPYEIDVNLVRGLDYYCDTVFEFKNENLGSQNTLIGGGRYDGLIKFLAHLEALNGYFEDDGVVLPVTVPNIFKLVLTLKSIPGS